MNKLKITLLNLTIVFSIYGQSKLSIGIIGSPDINFYKFYSKSFSDMDGVGKVSLGFSGGVSLNYKLNKGIDLFTNVVYSKKSYSPYRLFNFGVLREVRMTTLEIPLNAKYNLIKLAGPIDKIYAFGGLTYQAELRSAPTHSYLAGYDGNSGFIRRRSCILPGIGLGVEKRFLDTGLIRVQVNYRLLKPSSEYLNLWIDKIAFEVALFKLLPAGG